MNRRGFTAMELTVVLLIIAVAMLLVNYANGAARDRAGDTACISNLKQIGLGMLMYAVDHDLHMRPRRIPATCSPCTPTWPTMRYSVVQRRGERRNKVQPIHGAARTRAIRLTMYSIFL